MWLCGCVAVWLCGCVLCGCVAVCGAACTMNLNQIGEVGHHVLQWHGEEVGASRSAVAWGGSGGITCCSGMGRRWGHHVLQ